MRQLKTSDIPAFCRLLKEIGMQDAVKEIAARANNGATEDEIGLELIMALFDYATEANAEAKIYTFLASIFEKEPAELAEMSIPDFIAGLKEICVQNDLAPFFNSAAALTR